MSDDFEIVTTVHNDIEATVVQGRLS